MLFNDLRDFIKMAEDMDELKVLKNADHTSRLS